VQGDGGVASADELASQLLAARGSVEEGDAARIRLALAVLRAAVELEASVTTPRFAAYMETAPTLIAAAPELADYARRLGREADRLAGGASLPSPGRAEEELARVPASENAAPLPHGRMLRLAAAASTGAALSARLELYPRGMAPQTALGLSLGALAGPQMLTEAALRERVRGRFPEATPLPARPELDALLDRLGAERVWHEDGVSGAGYYPSSPVGSETGTSGLVRYGTLTPPPEVTPELLDARALEEKISHAAKTGAFLVLTVDPRRSRDAEAELLRRFPRQLISLEHLMLRAMRAEAEARRVPWLKVLAADAMARNSRDFQSLLRHASRSAPRMRNQVLALRDPALLTRPGLLARYELMDMLTAFAQASGTKDGPPSFWLLLPQPDAGMPRVDSSILPACVGGRE
jgi:hypothetical protein